MIIDVYVRITRYPLLFMLYLRPGHDKLLLSLCQYDYVVKCGPKLKY